MSTASLAAYDAIIPELPAREAAVLGVLRAFKESRQYEGPAGRTNRWIAEKLGLERDSVSPRTAKLRQKGLVVEVGIDDGQTLYEIVLSPNFVKAPGKRKPKAYYQALKDAHARLCAMIESGDHNTTDGLAEAAKAIEAMTP